METIFDVYYFLISVQNILAWTQFPPNLEVLDVDESMLNAKVRTVEQGLAKVISY